VVRTWDILQKNGNLNKPKSLSFRDQPNWEFYLNLDLQNRQGTSGTVYCAVGLCRDP